ncbi:jerky protein [Nephila pilipes]|uniref:Jerky protein n=1 Tax=Nephila pilipes TaxID=299642 RepID=A0A8X6JPW9_NEPPI|nr:jerky protein [Nephila pilipes]
MSLNKGSVYTILHERLQYRKSCAQWVPKHLTEEQKIHSMSVSMQHLMRHLEMGNQFVSRTIASDETRCYLFHTITKSMSMEWRHPSSARPKKGLLSTRTGKDMLTDFYVDDPLLS